MTLTKTQWTWIGLLLIAGVLIYVYVKRKSVSGVKGGSIKTMDGVIASNVINPSAPKEQQNYVGPQDCDEICDAKFDSQLKKCYEGFGGVPRLNDCLSSASNNKKKCYSPCSKAYPTNLNFNYDVRGNERDLFSNLFEQGYV
jgi:hypothetical protein